MKAGDANGIRLVKKKQGEETTPQKQCHVVPVMSKGSSLLQFS